MSLSKLNTNNSFVGDVITCAALAARFPGTHWQILYLLRNRRETALRIKLGDGLTFCGGWGASCSNRGRSG
jgi:hypothetical protein